MQTSIFESILNTNIINFLIVFYCLVLIFKKVRLGDLIQKMADDVKLSVEKSSKDAQDAIEEYKEVRKSVRNTPQLKEEIISQAKKNAENLKEKIEENTVEKQNEIKASLVRIFENQFKKYNQLAITEIYQASIELAKEEIIKRLDRNMHKKLIKSSIEELDKIEGSLS